MIVIIRMNTIIMIIMCFLFHHVQGCLPPFVQQECLFYSTRPKIRRLLLCIPSHKLCPRHLAFSGDTRWPYFFEKRSYLAKCNFLCPQLKISRNGRACARAHGFRGDRAAANNTKKIPRASACVPRDNRSAFPSTFLRPSIPT